MATTKILAILLIIIGLVCAVLIILLLKQKKKHMVLLNEIQPYEHWSLLPNHSYAIPLTCKLYVRTQDGIKFVGSVADNLRYFNLNSEKLLEDYFYGNNYKRSVVPVKIISANANQNNVDICSESGKKFVILRSNNKDFPRVIRIEFARES